MKLAEIVFGVFVPLNVIFSRIHRERSEKVKTCGGGKELGKRRELEDMYQVLAVLISYWAGLLVQLNAKAVTE
jgi:hypothetical protein